MGYFLNMQYLCKKNYVFFIYNYAICYVSCYEYAD